MTVETSRVLESRSPATDEIIATFPISTKSDVDAVVAVAKDASIQWQELGYHGRKVVLLKWVKVILERIDECANLISRETGKPLSDAKLEASLAIGHLSWAAHNAAEVLKIQTSTTWCFDVQLILPKLNVHLSELSE